MCATVFAAVAFCDTLFGGALKKYFTKDGHSENVKIGEEHKTAAPATTHESPKAAPGATATPASPAPERRKITGDPVVLRINGKKEYRRNQVMADLKLIPAQLTQGLSPDKLFEMLRDQKLRTYLMIEQAKKAGLDRTKDFLDRLEQVKDELLGRMFMVRELAPKAENEAALKSRYSKYLIEFKKGKEFKIYQIMVADEREAHRILEALAGGEDFFKLAREKSIAPSKSKDGEEGYIPIDLMPAPIKDKIIFLKSGEYTKEAVKTENGYHIFKVTDIRDTTPQKYEDALPLLKQAVVQEELVKMLDRLEKQAKVEKFNEDGTPVTAPALPLQENKEPAHALR
jgi:peptidyl-prolyl cis-trans isomerase C